MIELNFIDPTDGCSLSEQEVLGYLKPGLSDGPVATAEEFLETLSEVPDDGSENNTLVRSSTEQSGETELTDIGGLSCGERHSISGVTAGETAPPVDGRDELSDSKVPAQREQSTAIQGSASAIAGKPETGLQSHIPACDGESCDSPAQLISLTDRALLLLAIPEEES